MKIIIFLTIPVLLISCNPKEVYLEYKMNAYYKEQIGVIKEKLKEHKATALKWIKDDIILTGKSRFSTFNAISSPFFSLNQHMNNLRLIKERTTNLNEDIEILENEIMDVARKRLTQLSKAYKIRLTDFSKSVDEVETIRQKIEKIHREKKVRSSKKYIGLKGFADASMKNGTCFIDRFKEKEEFGEAPVFSGLTLIKTTAIGKKRFKYKELFSHSSYNNHSTKDALEMIVSGRISEIAKAYDESTAKEEVTSIFSKREFMEKQIDCGIVGNFTNKFKKMELESYKLAEVKKQFERLIRDFSFTKNELTKAVDFL